MTSINKVITAIGSLDDGTYCARSAFTHLGFGEGCAIVHCVTSQLAYPKMRSIDILVYLQPVG